MKIWISNRQRKLAINQENLRAKAEKILSALGWSEAEVSLTLVNDRAMARLNRETFGRRGPTNVIAFPMDLSEFFRGGGEGPQPPAPPPPTPQIVGNTGLQPVSPGEGGIPISPPPVIGEVVISIETTQRQAKENNWTFEELFDFYLIHGILHLLGYGHETPEDDAAMEAKTWELMEIVASNQ